MELVNIRLELGVDEIEQDIQNRKLKMFGHMKPMGEERILKKLLLTKMKVKLPRGRTEPD